MVHLALWAQMAERRRLGLCFQYLAVVGVASACQLRPVEARAALAPLAAAVAAVQMAIKALAAVAAAQHLPGCRRTYRVAVLEGLALKEGLALTVPS